MTEYVENADLVIIGGGCAGLSLAMRLAEDPDRAPHTVVIEPRMTYANDRTWAFWQGPAVPGADGLIAHHWHRWAIGTADEVVTHASPRAYVMIPAARFYEKARRAIARSGRVRLQLGTGVESVTERLDGVDVRTSRGLLRAKYVLDTRPPAPGRLARAILTQAFAGAEVITSRPAFDPTTAGLMTRMRADDDGLRFLYTLPVSPTRALIEATRFTPSRGAARAVEGELQWALDSLGVGFRVVRRERGRLPMGLPPAPTKPRSRIVLAGMGGGACRPATGYAFVRIQRWAEACAQRVLDGDPPTAHQPDPLVRRSMDRLFLKVLRTRPELGPRLFVGLAANVPVERFVRFLSDEASPLDLLRVVAALPPLPFLRALGPTLEASSPRLRSFET